MGKNFKRFVQLGLPQRRHYYFMCCVKFKRPNPEDDPHSLSSKHLKVKLHKPYECKCDPWALLQCFK